MRHRRSGGRVTRAPAAGAMSAEPATTLGTRRPTVHFDNDGVESTLPAASIARTANRCGPLASPAYFFGELQRKNERPSSRHWKVAGSLAEKVSLADVAVVLAGGLAARVVCGGVASIVQAYTASGPRFPKASIPLTTNLWRPSARSV